MAFECGFCMPARDSVYFQIENLHRRLDQTNDLLLYHHRNRESELRQRDKLATKLKLIEESARSGAYKCGRESSKTKRTRREKASRGDNLRSFAKWRKQLQIVLDALDVAMEYLHGVNTRRARRAIVELQELKDDITASLIETSRLMSSDEEAKTVSGDHDLRASKRSLEAIVNEAEHIRRVSHNLSAEMKNELQGLKSECVAMAKDLVALNRILEEQKRELIE